MIGKNSLEWIHQEVKVTVELDKVFPRHHNVRLLSEEPVGLHGVGDVVFQRVSFPDNPGERELVHHCSLSLASIGETESWGPDFGLDRLGEGVHVVLVPQVVEHQPGVDPLDEKDEVGGVGQLQGVNLREGEDADVDCDLVINDVNSRL